MLDLLIRDGLVVRPDGVERADVGVENERIVEIAPAISAGAREEIDATALHVFPGLIDPHVHFNEPGRTEWEGFETGSSALAAGGGTSFFDMPLNSAPPVLDGESFDLKLAAARKNSHADFGLWGGLTPGNFDKLEELVDRGVVGFKAFMCPSGIDDFEHVDPDTLHRGMRIVAKLGLPVAVHAEDPFILNYHRARVRGRAWSDYLDSRPLVCEDAAVSRAISTARLTECPLHVVHVSSPRVVVESIQPERQTGADVTCETCPHYLLLSAEDLPGIGARAKCAPPLRDRAGCDRLIDDLHDGRIDFVASDHSPAPASMKTGDDAFAIWGGISGVQSTLSALLTRWLERSLALERVPRLIAQNAAKRFKIAGKGQLAPGFDADLVLVDTNESFVLHRDELLDRHKLSPYVGMTFRGRVVRTILRGQTIFLNGRMVGSPGRAKLLKPAR
jgi:allantoinase